MLGWRWGIWDHPLEEGGLSSKVVYLEGVRVVPPILFEEWAPRDFILHPLWGYIVSSPILHGYMVIGFDIQSLALTLKALPGHQFSSFM